MALEKDIHILVIDDFDEIRTLCEELLKIHKYQVYTAGNGEEALEIIETKKIDIVVTDLFMPLMGGMELTSILNDDYPKIKVLTMTGGGDDFEANIDHFIDSSLAAGANIAIKKPFKNTEFIEAIRSMHN